MPPNNLRKSVAVSTDFIRFTLNKMRRLFSGSSLDIIAKIAWAMAKIGAGAASISNNYQPELPSQLITK